jgi:hypothetical protein
MRKIQFLALLLPCSVFLVGCAGKNIVKAAPPSVSAPPPEETAPMPPPATPPPVTTTEEPAPEVPSPAPPTALGKRPPAPRRPAPTETADPAPAKPAPPQISPQLSPKDLDATKKSTTSNITIAEQNLQLADGKQLSASQKDLSEKIKGFLGQSHEAIMSDDWVRAQNLAEKARVLSAELVKSF